MLTYVKKYTLLVLLILLIIPNKSYSPISDRFGNLNINSNYDTPIDQIIDFGRTLIGYPYRYKLKNNVLDCSGFISYIFNQKGILLPKSVKSLSKETDIININHIEKGDLMFFKGRNINNNNMGHVSIVTSVTDEGIEMMHSCNRGIITEIFNENDYYTSRLLCVGRIKKIPNISRGF